MPHVVLTDAALGDLERIVAHLRSHEPTHAASRTANIISAIDLLGDNPHIGRPAGGGRRELVIGREGRGYLALYRHAADIDTVFVLAIRSQREAGYLHD